MALVAAGSPEETKYQPIIQFHGNMLPLVSVSGSEPIYGLDEEKEVRSMRS